MHIVIVTPYYAPAWGYGGPPKVLSVLAANFVKSGNSVSVITTDALGSRRNTRFRETIDGVAVHRFPTISNSLAYGYKIFYVPNLLAKSRPILDQADCVLFSDVRSLLNWQLFGYVIKKRIRFGIFAFGQIPYDVGVKVFIKKCFDLLWVRRFMTGATWCFAQTEHERHMYRKYFHVSKFKTHILLLPVKIPMNVPRKTKIYAKEKVILFVGRFQILKGVDILIKSCVPLLRADSTLKLVLIGRNDGSEAYFRSLVPPDLKHSILFPGAVYGRELTLWYRSASCFAITPRYYEETSTAALEALTYGCPVVTVPESDIPFLTKYKAGLVIQNSVPVIRRAIRYVIKRRNEIQLHTSQLIRDHYEVGVVTDQLLQLLRSV